MYYNSSMYLQAMQSTNTRRHKNKKQMVQRTTFKVVTEDYIDYNDKIRSNQYLEYFNKKK